MPARRRLAIGVLPLLALLAALLLGWSGAAAQAPDPLTLTLTAERSECTAGTLNPVSWTISGGTAPYTLAVAGEPVATDATSVNVTCGALPEGASSAPGTITAVVTDAGGATATAKGVYTIVEPLPAPTELFPSASLTGVGLMWGRVAEAGAVPPLGSDCPCPLYLLRWRPAGTETWTLELRRDRITSSGQVGVSHGFFDLQQGTSYELAIATLRDVIEQETPGALAWSTPVTATTMAPATGVRAITTHDTVTVTWDPQPAVRSFSVSIRGPHGSAAESFTPDGSTPHRVVFRHLPPGTEWTVQVTVGGGDDGASTEITARTEAPPPDWEPLPRGPQNVRTSVTHDSVTVDWDAPYAGARDTYQVWIFNTGADREPTAHDRREYSLVQGSDITEHTFAGLASATTYVVYVTHPSIVSETVRVAVTTAPWLPPPAETPILPYKRFDSQGRALSPGSYAFLDWTGRPVTTYEALRDGTTMGLRIHQVDANGTSRTDSFGAAGVGDVLEWRQAEDCWVRYLVTSLLPDPARIAPRKHFAIRWVTYAGTGCSGALAPDTAVRIQWHPAPVVSGSVTSPVHHGLFVLHPPDWEGELPEQVEITLPEPPAGAPPTRSNDESLWPSRDLAVVWQHPLWRDPELPEGWTLGWARAQNGIGAAYGREGVFVESHYRDGAGASAMSIVVALIARRPTNIIPIGVVAGGGIFETRIIDGHHALLYHNPTGASDNPAGLHDSWTFVIIFDATTSVGYNVSVYLRTFVDLDTVIAIARSLYR